MPLTIEKRINAFALLGKELKTIAAALGSGNESQLSGTAAQKLFREAKEAPGYNPWFTAENVESALEALGEMLDENKLKKWVENYPDLIAAKESGSRKVAVIMAGNIPLVGFHDFLCVLTAGHQFLGKLSSQDNRLPVALGKLLTEIEPAFRESMTFSESPINGFNAVIATGSNNSARYFEYYFGRYPHIIRKNRNSVAILEGDETPEELQRLGSDVFSFFGLGCRNVSKLLVPKGYDFSALQNAWEPFGKVAYNHKYYNNYEYFKAIYIVNRTWHKDTGFCLLKPDASLSSPVSVVHYEEYPSKEWLKKYLEKEAGNIQCIVQRKKEKGTLAVPFGQSQQPDLWDYADGIDTLAFLMHLT